MKRNSSTRRQHVANPRPLKETYLSAVVCYALAEDDLPVGAGHQYSEWLLIRYRIDVFNWCVHPGM